MSFFAVILLDKKRLIYDFSLWLIFQMIFVINVEKPNEKSGIMEDFALLRFTILA